jgi:16S rRNA (uracil1498-N3)-methyltransferase
MPRTDFRTPRIYLDAPFAAGNAVALDRDQTNYLRNVLRLGPGDAVLLFNGRDGEWQAELAAPTKRALAAVLGERKREQPRPLDLHFMFAPLKHARLDYLVQKAVEMGVSRLQPVITRHTQVARLNIERMHANAIEAAQQCGVMALPEIKEPVSFKSIAGTTDADRLLVFCDEDADVKDPVAVLAAARPQAARAAAGRADRARRRIFRRRARGFEPAAERGAAGARAAHPARRHRRGGGAGFGADRVGRLGRRVIGAAHCGAVAGNWPATYAVNARTQTTGRNKATQQLHAPTH